MVPIHGLDGIIYITPVNNWDRWGNLDPGELLDTILHEIQHGQNAIRDHDTERQSILFQDIVNGNINIYNKEFGH